VVEEKGKRSDGLETAILEKRLTKKTEVQGTKNLSVDMIEKEN